MRLLARVLYAIPFLFGLLRWIQTGTDHRYLVVALASAIVASVSVRRRAPGDALNGLRLMPTFLIGTVVASAVGYALGGRNVPAVLMVGGGMALCSTLGAALARRDSR